MKIKIIQSILLLITGSVLTVSCGKGADESLANPLDTAAVPGSTQGGGPIDKKSGNTNASPNSNSKGAGKAAKVPHGKALGKLK